MLFKSLNCALDKSGLVTIVVRPSVGQFVAFDFPIASKRQATSDHSDHAVQVKLVHRHSKPQVLKQLHLKHDLNQ